jgi:hypothetical protein
MDKIKARSRLRRSSPATPITPTSPATTTRSSVTNNPRWRFWPLLLLGGLFYATTLTLMHYISPQLVQNWLWPNSYLPMQILVFAGNFFTFTFLTLHKKLGLALSLFCGSLLFLHLQAVQLDWLAVALAAILSSTLFWLLLKI